MATFLVALLFAADAKSSPVTVDLTVILSVVSGIVALGVALWKGVPEMRKASAERDAIIADTYQQVIGDVRGELERLRIANGELRSQVDALHSEIALLRDELERARRA